ncbi:hypothetical protein ASPVEDRAFT_47338 [Aspergillus versicolor CBS 583.65]|uniref:F-box domain-containing protein n=1 Tax=Aspergillus versicolor CBS 583.65 TaxID=1036611 RepID=A0A1L9Q351_ASPVE|nr:uncharacterized protein ASPVEDRAFT_47338 [Aspergillus versicolor CBS 583.65]OJJ08132.1 hypothetical protein ASPVEDRAFT_47338 [Aspergillus versicolor CBS 583.65]
MASFLSLPLEVLDRVYEYVASGYQPSLSSLALVNKYCYRVASKHRFRRVTIKAPLDQGIKRWTDLLQSASAFADVRRLSIMFPNEGGYHSNHSYYTSDLDDLTCIDEYYDHAIWNLFRTSCQHKDDNEWESLVTLVSQLCGLQDLIWACEIPFPPPLLDFLHQKLPDCRLHNMAFRLPSLHYHSSHPQGIDSRDFTLATSPNLTSALVPMSRYDHDGNVGYDEEAVMQMSAKLALNLREVHAVERPIEACLEHDQAVERGRPPWQGFFPTSPTKHGSEPPQQARLQRWGLNPARIDLFRQWETKLDFSTLQVLHLWQVDVKTLQSVSSHSLKSLRVLAIDLKYPEDHDMNYSLDEAIRLDEAAASFVLALPPLNKVHFSGVHRHENAFQTIIQFHGASLHTLSLISSPCSSLPGPLMTVSRVQQIQAHCPNIRDLRVPILRTRGNAAEGEATMYQNLGVFTHLTHLELQLRPREPDPESLIDDTDYIDPQQIPDQELLVRAAVDEALAREIFTKIITAGARSLQYLRVQTLTDWVPLDLEPIASIMARNWDCMRIPRVRNSPANIQVDVKEIGARLKDLERRKNGGPKVSLAPYEKIFRELWPVKGESWEDDWHSFPLEANEGA